jgi:hypothetical protein
MSGTQSSPNIIPINRLSILFSEKFYCVIFIPLFIKKLKSWGLSQTLFIHYPTNWFLSRLTLRARRAATAGTNQKKPLNRPNVAFIFFCLELFSPNFRLRHLKTFTDAYARKEIVA